MQPDIRPLDAYDLTAASALVQQTFDRFESPDYPAEGVETFYRFTTPEAMTERLCCGQMKIWGAFRDRKLIGVLAARDASHISLLFVDEDHHRQGIARALFTLFCNLCRTDASVPRITVNSSPYAVECYIRLGFTPTDTERTENGIRFTPMEYIL